MLEVVERFSPKDAVGELTPEGESSDVVHDLLAHLAEENRVERNEGGGDPTPSSGSIQVFSDQTRPINPHHEGCHP